MGKKKGGVRVKQVGPKAPMGNPLEALADFPTDEIHLPPTPDRKYQVIWPIQETFSMDTTGFQVIYPSYVDKNVSIRKGRRVSQELAVPKPTVTDLSQALQQMNARHVLQPYKGYSRDTMLLWDNPGRVLVDVSNQTKKEFMKELCQRIPDLPDRQTRLEREAAEKAEEEKQLAEAAAAAAAAKKAPTTTASGSKKKGKKGKRK